MDQEDTAPEFDPFAEPKTKSGKGSGGRLMALLALLVALAVAGWNGWAWWQSQQDAGVAADLERAIADLRSTQAALQRDQASQATRLASVERLELASGLAQLDQAIEQAQSVAGSDRARLEGLEGDLDDAQQRLDAVEGRLAAVVVRGESPRQGLDLAEIDYLLRSANERLLLYGDVRTADQALSLADAQLAAMDDPVYLSVRQSIAGARLALEDVDRPDTIALTQSLAQLQIRIPGLPFPGEITVEEDDGDVDTIEDPGVWARFTAAVSGLVTVRRRADDEALVSLEDKDYVRQGLWLQLESARLALLRGDDDGWQAALERASATVDQYFDQDSAVVERFAETLGRASAVSLVVDWPDISEPWVRLQGIREVAPEQEAGSQPQTPVDPPVNPEGVEEAAAQAEDLANGPSAEAPPEDEGFGQPDEDGDGA